MAELIPIALIYGVDTAMVSAGIYSCVWGDGDLLGLTSGWAVGRAVGYMRLRPMPSIALIVAYATLLQLFKAAVK